MFKRRTIYISFIKNNLVFTYCHLQYHLGWTLVGKPHHRTAAGKHIQTIWWDTELTGGGRWKNGLLAASPPLATVFLDVHAVGWDNAPATAGVVPLTAVTVPWLLALFSPSVWRESFCGPKAILTRKILTKYSEITKSNHSWKTGKSFVQSEI